MASNPKNRQKKLAKKKKKRSLKKKILNAAKNLSSNGASYSQYPVYECLAPGSLFETGLGAVAFTRALPNGGIAVSLFLVDVYCLGVKNAMFQVMSKFDYQDRIKNGLLENDDDLEKIHPACARKIITGAVHYAKNLGLSPHPDYRKAIGLFSGIDSTACPEKYEYGKDGKPFYVQGPHETIAQSRKIVNKLIEKCGKGNFEYMIMIDEDGLF